MTATKQKARSRNYPALSLVEAIQRARQLYDRDGKAVVPSEVAVQAWGYKGLNGASLRVLAALRQYGLLDDGSNRSVRLSQRALTILLEPDESADRALAIREAAKAPAVFAEIMEHYGDDIPSDPALVSHLVRNENFSEDAAKALIAAFRATAALAAKVNPPDIPRGGMGADTKDGQPGGKPGSPSPPPAPPGGSRMEFTWPLSGDAVATLTVTRSLDPDDIETLNQYFEIAKKALTKAARVAMEAREGDRPEGGA